MQIIKRGKKPEPVIWKGTCSCGTVIECLDYEVQNYIKVIHSLKPSGPYVVCPICDNRISVVPK